MASAPYHQQWVTTGEQATRGAFDMIHQTDTMERFLRLKCGEREDGGPEQKWEELLVFCRSPGKTMSA